jgi:hypothetical protein
MTTTAEHPSPGLALAEDTLLLPRPRRIQLSRRAGWRLPANTIVVSRPTRYGNPFTVAEALETGYADTVDDARRLCVQAFDEWLAGSNAWWRGPASIDARVLLRAAIPALRGKNLACWCPLTDAQGRPGPCHANILLPAANPGDTW